MAYSSQSPAQTLESFLAEVRSYLRDFQQLNRLLDAEETTDRQLRWHIAEVLDDFTMSPPPIGVYSIERIPRSILLKGVLAETLRSAAILYHRNSLRYTDGQVVVDLDKHRELLAISQMFAQEYEVKKTKFKVAENINQAYETVGGVDSEYLILAGFYGTYGGDSYLGLGADAP